MLDTTTATASNVKFVTYVKNGKGVFPCRCGEVHRGDYAMYVWEQHNCFHNSALVKLDKLGDVEQVVCPDCGKVFDLEEVK